MEHAIGPEEAKPSTLGRNVKRLSIVRAVDAQRPSVASIPCRIKVAMGVGEAQRGRT